MDLETENRIAAILLKEAAELRRQAEKEGVHVYLQSKGRVRPNSRFLTGTVLGVQQANRSVEVSEMWRVRQKELELNDRLKGRSKDRSSSYHRDIGDSSSISRKRPFVDDYGATAASSDRECESSYSRKDEGLRGEEVEEFLHSRVKRGRGGVGSRMDETGPYLAPSADPNGKLSTSSDVWQHRILGPQKPPSLKPCESSEEDEGRRKKTKKEHSRKHKSKERSKHKKKKKTEEKRRKHRK